MWQINKTIVTLKKRKRFADTYSGFMRKNKNK